MDKNKDFIRLDDVFQSLGQGEEPYQPGAWGKMKNLLDEEMPLNTGLSSGNSVMRYLIPLLALLLAGTGFYFWNQHRQANLAATMTSTGGGSASTSSNQPAASNKHTLQEKPQLPGQQPESSNMAGGFIPNNKAKQSEVAHPHNNVASAVNNNTRANSAEAVSRDVAAEKQSSYGAKGMSAEAQLNHHDNEKIPLFDAKEIALLDGGSLSKMPETTSFFAQEKSIPTDIIELQLSLTTLEKEQVLQQWKPEFQEPENTIKPTNIAAEIVASNRLEKVEHEGTLPVYQAENGGLYKEQRDTFKRLELARKLPNGYSRNENKPVKPILDTVSFKQVAKVSFVPLTYAEIKANHLLPKLEKTALIPESRLLRSASVENTETAVDMVPLKQYKVSSRKMDASAISRLIHSANSGIAGLMDGSKNWYISLLLGGNAGLGSPNAYGMQIGANFLYAVAERWTLSLGVKYQNSFYPNFRFWDSAISYGDMHEDKSQMGTTFSGTEYQKQTAVNVNRLARVSVPVLLSYNLGRVSIFAGPEFSYFFPLQNETTSSFQTKSVSKLAYDNKNPFTNVPYQLDPENDFRSRFAAGYALGLSYDFSRKLSLDIRLSQMLWDNTGKYQLDALRHIYHQPAVELNLGFFLGRKEKVIYIMDRNR